jgi:hypothetical protein
VYADGGVHLVFSRRQALSLLAASMDMPLSASALKPSPKGASVKKQPRHDPLFLDEEDARAVIQRYCVDDADDAISPVDVEFLMTRLQPQLWLAPQKAEATTATRFGGTPDLPYGMVWPPRPPQTSSSAFHAHGDAHAATNAERGKTLLGVAALHLVEQRGEHARA